MGTNTNIRLLSAAITASTKNKKEGRERNEKKIISELDVAYAY